MWMLLGMTSGHAVSDPLGPGVGSIVLASATTDDVAFGRGVALDYAGNTLVVVAGYADTNGPEATETTKFAAHIYDRVGDSWQLVYSAQLDTGAKVLDSENYKSYVSISDDGQKVVVTAQLFTFPFEITAKCFYIITKTNGVWDASLSSVSPGDEVAGQPKYDADSSSCLSGDGRVLAVSYPNFLWRIGAGPIRQGGVSIYLVSETGTLLHIAEPRLISNTKFGYRIAVDSQGSRVAISSIDQNGVGTVFVYDLNSTNPNSSRLGATIEIVPSATMETDLGGVSYRFGSSLAFNAAGTRLAVGITKNTADLNIPSLDGTVAIYDRGEGPWGTQVPWQLVGYMSGGPVNEVSYTYFGHQVSMSADGNKLVVGNPGLGRIESQPTLVLDGTAGSVLTTLFPDPSAPGYVGSFGEAVAISGDGSTVVVGDPNWYDDSGSKPISGRVIVYDI